MRCIKENTAITPVSQPLTAKDLKGIKGSRRGVMKAPEKTAVNPKIKNGMPSSHASLNRMPDGWIPNNSSIIRPKSGNFFMAGLISIGVSTSLSIMLNRTNRISGVLIYPALIYAGISFA